MDADCTAPPRDEPNIRCSVPQCTTWCGLRICFGTFWLFHSVFFPALSATVLFRLPGSFPPNCRLAKFVSFFVHKFCNRLHLLYDVFRWSPYCSKPGVSVKSVVVSGLSLSSVLRIARRSKLSSVTFTPSPEELGTPNACRLSLTT